MPKIHFTSDGGPRGKKRPVFDRPEHPTIGDTFVENGQTLVWTGRDWAWFPSTASELIRFARLHRWGARVTIEPKYELVGRNVEGDQIYRPEVKIVLLVGRNPGKTIPPAKTSKGYLYRLMWDTSRTGVFELVNAYRKTSTDPKWTEPGSISEIRPIISRFPVVPEKTGETDNA